jgi:SAM-dependent methyltransferase
MSIGYYPGDNDSGMPVPYLLPTLKELYSKYHKDGFPDMDSEHSYLEVYAERLEQYRFSKKINILECGLFNGQRFLLWKDYYRGKVWGMDCDEQPHGGMADLRPLIEQGENIFIGDAENKNDIEKFFKDVKFDVVIEDCGHHLSQQLAIYHNLKHYLAPGAIYIIEDIQDIDFSRKAFEMIDPKKNIEIVDRRQIKNRYDDVLIIITDKA